MSGTPGMEALIPALRPALDLAGVTAAVPELELSRGVEQSSFHHLDTFDHVLEVISGVERELESGTDGDVGADILPERVDALRVSALLHDIAKPVTRGVIEGRVAFVAHDTIGGSMAANICLRLGASALYTDMAVTLTVLHLKIGFMGNPRTDYPIERLVAAAGPFGEELTVLSWADRMAAHGPRLKEEHILKHRDLCREFLTESRRRVSQKTPDYEEFRVALPDVPESVIGRAASRARLLSAAGTEESEAMHLAVSQGVGVGGEREAPC